MMTLLVLVQPPTTSLWASLRQKCHLFLLGNGCKKCKAWVKVSMGMGIQLQSDRYYGANGEE